MSFLDIMNRIITSNKSICMFVVGTGASVSIGRVLARTLISSQCRSFTSEDLSSSGKRKKSGLYTKTGDSGSSSLYNGERRPKADIVFEVLGHQDELNAVIGIAREHCALTENGLEDMLKEIQSRLFDLGAAVATPVQTSSSRKKAYTEFPALHTAILEEWIDRIDSTLPPIVNFVIPSGGMSSTHLNLARAVCRRAERCVYPLVHAEQVDAEVGRYLNRLSDFLFAATRAAALREGREELLWRKAVLPSVVADKANTAAASAADSFTNAGTVKSINAVNNAEPEIHLNAVDIADQDDDTEYENLSLHSTETPAGQQDAFQGFDDDFFDPTTSAESVRVKNSERSTASDTDDHSVTSRCSISPKSKAVKPSRILPKMAVKSTLKGPPLNTAAISVTSRKPFTTGIDNSSPRTSFP